ncbi:MAG: hypothetical protein COB23_08100 [Methylophaga sp.]|nr:MAG: hypothetical protein COB23_08100 [Methylophaga sp.]
MPKIKENKICPKIINKSLFYSHSTSKDLIIEASLRSASLLELSQTVNVDGSFIDDLKNIYKTTRFSVDIDGCVLFRFVNGLWWEAMSIIQTHKFNDQCQWEKVDNKQFNKIDSLYQMRQDVATSGKNNNVKTSGIGAFLSQGNIHFERFRGTHGGIAFKPTAGNVFTQYDSAFLTHVAAIISFCVNKDDSSHYLQEVYQNIQGIADKVKVASENTNITPSLYISSDTELHSKLGFLRIIKYIVETRQLNSYIVVLSIDQSGSFIKLLDEKVKQAFLNKAITRIKAIIPDNNTLSYIDDTDFAFIVINSEPSIVIKLLSQISHAFLNHLLVDEYRVHCEIRAGYSCYSSSSSQPEELLKMASIALFQAQSSQEGKIIGYEKEIVQKLQLRLELSLLLSSAIDNNEFEVYFQPIVAVAYIDKAIHHYEALIRWNHPEIGLIPPDKFIDVAEENGTIIKLGYWVIKRVCECLSMPAVPEEVGISVNLSPIQLEESDLVQKIIDILDEYSISPQRITLEITESMAMKNCELTKIKFSEFHAAGFKLSMDDFGTGYSSLSYLLNFSFDILKIDKCFIDNTLTDEKYAVIGRAVVKLAHDLSLSVVCEGIETDEQFQMVKSWGTEMIQGYLFSKPKPWGDFY